MKKFILGIVLFLSMVSSVKASGIYLTKDRVDDVYTYYYDSNQGRYRFLYATKYRFEDRVAYCLELGKDINSNLYDFTTSLDISGISKDDLEYVKLVSYYGYDYPGHNTDEYYMAAQELIWRRLSNTNISWVRDMEVDNKVDVSYEKSMIEMRMRYHYKKPSFADTEVEVVMGKEKWLLDNNSVLMNYGSYDDENVRLAGNNLLITDKFRGSEVVLRKINYNKNAFFVYTNGSSQKMLSAGMLDEVEARFKVKLIGGSLTVHKFDSETRSEVSSGEASLTGTTYQIFNSDDELVDNIVIGEKETVDNLAVGKYYLKEKKAGSGYLLDDNIYEFEITSDNLDISLDLYDEVIKRRVDIFKVFASDKTEILVGEENVTFEIYNRNDDLVDSITTDSEGKASVVLPYGTYTFKQVNASYGYEKVDDFVVSITDYDDRPIYKVIANSEIKVKLRVIKKDLDTNKNIVNSNIRFKIFDVKNNEFVSYRNTYLKEETILEFKVDGDGIFILPVELGFGEYILYEVDDNMNGYLYNSEPLHFTIDNNTNLVDDEKYGKVIEIPFYNKRVKGRVDIVKYGEDVVYEDNFYSYKKILLDEVLFEVHAKCDIYENGVLIYKSEDLVGNIVTDSNGRGMLDNLPLGSYYVKEISSSNNNVVSDKQYDIELKYRDQYTDKINYKLEINNFLAKGKLVINKFETDSEIGIANTLMEIRNSKGITVYNGYTDKNGQIVINDLPYGDYYLAEVEASTGYRLLQDNVYFSIGEEENIIDVYNDRIEVPNTGISDKNYFLIGGIVFLVVSFVFMGFKMKAKGILMVVISCGLFCIYGVNCYFDYLDRSNNERSVSYYIENREPFTKDERYSYIGILDIPSINLKRGFLKDDSDYNDVKYNIELIRYSESQIILASHNGNNSNSYFGNLSKLEFGDEINIYYGDKIYKYVYSDNYEIKKDGYASIYTEEGKNSVVLITCSDSKRDAQVVHIGYLKSVNTY